MSANQTSNSYREYDLPVCGQLLAVSYECVEDVHQVGVSLPLNNDCEVVATTELSIFLVGNSGQRFNCTYSWPGDVLPSVQFSHHEAACAVYKFESPTIDDPASSLTLSFQGTEFLLFLNDTRYRCDLTGTADLPDYFPSQDRLDAIARDNSIDDKAPDE